MRSTLSLLAIALLGCTLASADAVPPDTSPMPQTLSRPSFDQPYPLFVAASATVNANGQLESSNFGGSALRDVSILLEKASQSSGCYTYGAVKDAVALGEDRSDFRRALRASPVAFMAEVTGAQAGFEYGIPGQLLRLRVEEVLRGQALLAEYYYFVPVARFRVGAYEICKTDERFADPPAVGDRVLMMLARDGCCAQPYIDSHDAYEGTQMTVLPAQGAARSGPDLAHSTPKLTQHQFREWVRDLAAGVE